MGSSIKCNVLFLVVCEDFCANLYTLSNEPSLALYRLQEHVKKSLPVVVEKKVESQKLQCSLQNAQLDVENMNEAVDGMKKASAVFVKIQESLKSSIFYKQQLDYDKGKRRSVGMYHIDSSDSLFQEVRKSKSLAYLKSGTSPRRSGSESRDEVDIMSESVVTRSTTSTPVSDFPDFLLSRDVSEDQLWMVGAASSAKPSTNRDAPDRQGTLVPADMIGQSSSDTEEEDRSSTPTSGADSHVSEDAVDRTLSQLP